MASVVVPGSSRLLPPEFVRPQDGAEKQDCETNAAKRRMKRVGPELAWMSPVYLGSDLHCRQPLRQTILDAGSSFILTCKPASHTTLHEWIQGIELVERRRTEKRDKRRRRFRYRWMKGVPARDGGAGRQALQGGPGRSRSGSAALDPRGSLAGPHSLSPPGPRMDAWVWNRIIARTGEGGHDEAGGRH